MSDLTTRYMGLELRNPLVASSSPLTGDLGAIRELEDAGAAAVVLPSLFQEQVEAEMDRYERLTAAGGESFPEASTYIATHAVRHRGRGPYLDLVTGAAAAVDIPIIGSLNGTTAEGWISCAREIEEAGASALELNVYFLPTDLSLAGPAVEQRYLDVLNAVRAEASIPVAMKLSPFFSATGNMVRGLDGAGADALVLFNRLFQPDIDLVQLRVRNDVQLSTRSEIRLPLLWISVLAGNVGASLAASTGVETVDEVLKYLLAGADVVMTTSALLRHGPRQMRRLLVDLQEWLEVRDLGSLDQVRGMLSHSRLRAASTFERVNYMEIVGSDRAWPADWPPAW